MPNWLDLLKLMNQQGNEPDPTPGRYTIPPELLPDVTASNKDSTVLKQSPVTYPTISEDPQTYPPGLFESGGAAGVSRGESGTWEKPPPPPPPQFVSGGAIGGASRGTTGDWNAPTPPTVVTPTLPQPAVPPQAQSTSNLDAVQQAISRGSLVSPENPGGPIPQPMVKRAQLIAMPDLIQQGLPPSEMVTPDTGMAPRAQLVTAPTVKRGVLVVPAVQPAIPVTAANQPVTTAPRAQLVQAHPYDLSTYSSAQMKTFLDKIKGLPEDQPIPASVYESVVPIPKAQLVAAPTPATVAAVAAAAKGAPQAVPGAPSTTPATVPSGQYSAAKINSIFGKGRLAGYGQQFIDTAAKYNLNPYVLASISALETGYGSSNALAQHNNVGGLMDPHSPQMRGFQHFNSIGEGIDAFASLIKRRYADRGLNTIGKMAPVYSPPNAANDPRDTNRYWGPNVSSIYRRLAS